ncbi:MAG TPA: TetR/AcrR family transcriptional regulator C-terminal domain-containing protein [Chloroflexota bacterium]|nr:TetR/AcrR family transcriptional regulator C-terminal domain-containing protein [Chloroflexota bacterium]
MARRKSSEPEARERLSRERVLRAAIALADRDGIDALSMRRLAEELGVEAMSLYYYVENKDDILAGMLELVMSELDLPAIGEGGLDWKAALRRGAISFHDALRAHPWARGLMLSPKMLRAWRMRLMEFLLGGLRRGGLSPELTYHAYHALDSHLIGSTAWEAGYASFARGQDAADLAQRFLKQLPQAELPYVTEHIRQHMEGFGRGKSQFQFGLDLILSGLERLRDEEHHRAGQAPNGAPAGARNRAVLRNRTKVLTAKSRSERITR